MDWECVLACFQGLDFGSLGTVAILVPAVRYVTGVLVIAFRRQSWFGV